MAWYATTEPGDYDFRPDGADGENKSAQHAERWRRFIGGHGTRYGACSFDSYHQSHPAQKAVLDDLRRYAGNLAEHVAKGQGIVLFGPSGTGKDHLCIALARVAVGQDRSVAWTCGPNLFGAFRSAMSTDTPEDNLIEPLTSPDILILSDPVPPGGTLTEFQAATLYRIVDARYNAMKPTWTTINVGSSSEASERIGAAIIDRLKDGALALHCSWPSFRKSVTPSRNGEPS